MADAEKKAAQLKHYKLGGKQWDGKKILPAGAIVQYEEGKQPKNSKEVDEPELEEPDDTDKKPAKPADKKIPE